ncbi:hypothetical protein ACFOD0_00555 [Shewanella intestini]|uniref:HNH endonuclease n=1 Tax=Shewanella intestini TaxID=2017544 RepID=A0ABS5HZ65_9GAMM|nr:MULTISPECIES: hypothetical protein [Shewanella]MBR9727061.1 hypothetical protein [Shewanella intestini]MRG35863.1 hypothetical protein [Shewanella sp. XMDDZSB0408]
MIHAVDVPFDKRHQCWFCEEPSAHALEYYRLSHTPHPSISVPACKECMRLANKHLLTSIWDCRAAVKQQLMYRYQKDLAIGINWTEQELKESEFDCKVFGGFKKSAWMMYNIAKDRINAQGWELSVDGQPISTDGDTRSLQIFEFDGLEFVSLTHAIAHYAQTLSLSAPFLQQLVTTMGKNAFGKAVKIARLHIGITHEHQQKIINNLIEDQDHL